MEPIKRRLGKEWVHAFEKCCDKLKICERKCKLFISDHDFSAEINSTINMGGKFQAITQYQNRCNTARRAMRMTKWFINSLFYYYGTGTGKEFSNEEKNEANLVSKVSILTLIIKHLQ